MTPDMHIYLAAPWTRKEEAKVVRDQLVAAGYIVTSRWLDFVATPGDNYTHETMRREAENDIADISNSDVMVVLNLEKSEGKATEQGIALARGVPVIAVGPWEITRNVFQHLDNHFIRVDTLQDAFDVLATGLDGIYSRLAI